MSRPQGEWPEEAKLSLDVGRAISAGQELSPLQIVKTLNQIGGRNGVGLVDMVENRRPGIKSREIYEAPAAIALHTAHKELQSFVVPRGEPGHDNFHWYFFHGAKNVCTEELVNEHSVPTDFEP